jgi:pyruvate kinase
MLKGGVARLTSGSELELWTAAPNDFIGDEKVVSVDYRNLPLVVSKDSIIKIDDGLIVCKVLSCDATNNRLRVRIQNTYVFIHLHTNTTF